MTNLNQNPKGVLLFFPNKSPQIQSYILLKINYQEDIFDAVVQEEKSEGEEEPYDEKYDEALAIVAKDRQASISYIQRRLRIGYNRAARIIETMEREGVVGPSDGVRPREVYVSPIEIE